jgi:phage I-like protein
VKQLTKHLDKNSLKVVRASFREEVVLSDSGEGKQLPEQIRLFKLGPNDTTKGKFWLADWCIDACIHAEKERGVDYPINKNHSFAEAYGWFSLARGEGGHLFASRPQSKPELNGIWWLDTPAVDEVKKGQWRYTSAEFWIVPEWVEDEDGYIVDVTWWIVEIVGLALTNYPATHNAEPLLTSVISKEVPYFAQLDTKSPLEFKAMSEVANKKPTEPANNPVPPTVTPAQPTQEQLMSVWNVACEITKKTSAPEVCGTLRAHASSHENLLGLAQELSTLKSTQVQQEQADKTTKETTAKSEKLERAKASVNKAIDEFKVPRSNFDKTLSLAGENGEKVEELEAHLAALHPILAPGPVVVQASNNGVKPVTPLATVASLSQAEKEVAKTLGISEEDMAKTKVNRTVS